MFVMFGCVCMTLMSVCVARYVYGFSVCVI